MYLTRQAINLLRRQIVINRQLLRLSSSKAGFDKSNMVSSSSQGNFISTGIHEARYPQQEMIAMHRRNAKLEDVKLERRRRLQLVKIAIAAAVVVATEFAFCYSIWFLWTVGYPDI